jgi:hypothetical protein
VATKFEFKKLDAVLRRGQGLLPIQGSVAPRMQSALQYTVSMLTGKRYRLNAATLAIESSGNKRTAITIMESEIVEVIQGPRPDDTRMVDVKWNGKELVIFVQDLYDRGEYIGGRTASA